MRVSDPGGLADVAAVVVWPGNSAPVVTIDAPTALVAWKVGDAITFAGTAGAKALVAAQPTEDQPADPNAEPASAGTNGIGNKAAELNGYLPGPA